MKSGSPYRRALQKSTFEITKAQIMGLVVSKIINQFDKVVNT